MEPLGEDQTSQGTRQFLANLDIHVSREQNPLIETMLPLLKTKSPAAKGPDVATLIAQMLGGGRPSTETGNVSIERTGEKIILPAEMSYDSAIEWLQRKREEEETVVNISHSIPCFPQDGLIAFAEAFQRKFGFTDMLGTSGFWGDNPPLLVKIVVNAKGDFKQAPYCKLSPPVWEGGWLEPYFAGKTNQLMIRGEIKRKFEKQVRELLALAEQIVMKESIYKGQAWKIDLGFVKKIERGEIRFDPYTHRPEFLKQDHIKREDLILNPEEEFLIESRILMRIMQPEALKTNNIKLKHGALLTGTYGTGKTSSGMVIGALACRHGFTFIYAKDVNEIVAAFELAKIYGPTVVLFEDVDVVVSGERNSDMNAVLEALDGIDSKNAPVISLFTTNFPDRINPAFMRPGRVDTLIEFHAPAEGTAGKFIELNMVQPDGTTLLSPDVDIVACGAACKGFVAATIAQVLEGSKCRAIMRHGSELVGKVTTEDITLSAKATLAHIERTKDKPQETYGQKAIEALSLLADVQHGEITPSMANQPAPVS